MAAFITETYSTSITRPICSDNPYINRGGSCMDHHGGYDPVFPNRGRFGGYGDDYCDDYDMMSREYYNRGHRDAMRTSRRYNKQYEKNQKFTRDVAMGTMFGAATAMLMDEDPRKGALLGAAGGLLWNIFDKNA